MVGKDNRGGERQRQLPRVLPDRARTTRRRRRHPVHDVRGDSRRQRIPVRGIIKNALTCRTAQVLATSFISLIRSWILFLPRFGSRSSPQHRAQRRTRPETRALPLRRGLLNTACIAATSAIGTFATAPRVRNTRGASARARPSRASRRRSTDAAAASIPASNASSIPSGVRDRRPLRRPTDATSVPARDRAPGGSTRAFLTIAIKPEAQTRARLEPRALRCTTVNASCTQSSASSTAPRSCVAKSVAGRT